MTDTFAQRNRKIAIAAVLLMALALAACGDDDPGAAGDDPSPTTGASTPAATIPRDNLPAPVVRAIEAAANDASVSPDAVGLLAYTEERWNDTSLGCPQPDVMYAQVVTPGYNVLVIIDGNQREYHTDMGSAVVTCAMVVQ